MNQDSDKYVFHSKFSAIQHLISDVMVDSVGPYKHTHIREIIDDSSIHHKSERILKCIALGIGNTVTKVLMYSVDGMILMTNFIHDIYADLQEIQVNTDKHDDEYNYSGDDERDDEHDDERDDEHDNYYEASEESEHSSMPELVSDDSDDEDYVPDDESSDINEGRDTLSSDESEAKQESTAEELPPSPPTISEGTIEKSEHDEKNE